MCYGSIGAVGMDLRRFFICYPPDWLPLSVPFPLCAGNWAVLRLGGTEDRLNPWGNLSSRDNQYNVLSDSTLLVLKHNV